MTNHPMSTAIDVKELVAELRESAQYLRTLGQVSTADRNDRAADALKRLDALINTPQTNDWVQAVQLEAAHQQERWGAEHDAGKSPADWFWLLGYLSGKALSSFIRGDTAKGLHHIVSSSAALLNWHRHATGEMTGMRPGIAPPVEQPANAQDE